MALVKIIKGFYGLKTNNGIRAKGIDDVAFELDDVEANRIIELGIAKYAEKTTVATLENHTVNKKIGDSTIEKEILAKNDFNNNDIDIPKYDSTSSVSDLRAIAKDVGITFKVGMSKSDMIAALDEYFGAIELSLILSAGNPVKI